MRPQAAMLVLGLMLAVSSPVRADALYRVTGPDGKAASLVAIADAMAHADVVYLGEEHNDEVGHRLEAELFRLAASQNRPVALSLEMFEQDVQPVVDEYLADLIRDKDFLSDSRPWPNYVAAYAPLIGIAHARKLPVIAANAPRRYVNLVSRLGPEALDGLPATARGWLAPLPLPSASAAYAAKFRHEMGAMGQHSGQGLLSAQVLRDATMAWAIARYERAHPGTLVVQVNGKFHSEGGLGVPEQLKKYDPGLKQLVVTIAQEPNPGEPAPLGDFVIVTKPMPGASPSPQP